MYHSYLRGCKVDKKMYKEGENFQYSLDRCVHCECTNGKVTCTKRACNLVNCPKQFIKQNPGSCCPQCTGSRTVYNLKRHCLFGTHVYPSSVSFTPDICTTCSCQEGTVICERKTCPVLDCHVKDVIVTAGVCCNRCKPRKKCRNNGKSYKHGERWSRGLCYECNCNNGVMSCSMIQCQKYKCPRNFELKMIPGECCPRCVERNSICTVFGDPHYRTFDGKIYNFQGVCRYVLTRTCYDKTFQIRVKNHARRSATYAWTKQATVLFHGVRVMLRPKLKVRVDKKRVKLPHEIRDLLAIEITWR
ncbi:BMP-binding endothelial regulator protein-like [Tubulanus polymorphus]|uniref:BMP-binding endothelial regulator protein-like n=1 Tax=Tubulanus polymorphus TaxID=672921 RepID=UPI003DA3C93E